MVGDEMTFVNYLAGNVLMFVNIFAHAKESSFNLILAEYTEKLWRIVPRSCGV